MIISKDTRRRFFIRSQAVGATNCISAGTAAASLRNEATGDQTHKHSRSEQLVGVVVANIIRRLGSLACFLHSAVVKGFHLLGGLVGLFEYVLCFHDVCVFEDRSGIWVWP
jgi:hypothetical protein